MKKAVFNFVNTDFSRVFLLENKKGHFTTTASKTWYKTGAKMVIVRVTFSNANIPCIAK